MSFMTVNARCAFIFSGYRESILTGSVPVLDIFFILQKLSQNSFDSLTPEIYKTQHKTGFYRFCRGIENRTLILRSQTARTTIMLYPVLFLVMYDPMTIGTDYNTLRDFLFCFFKTELVVIIVSYTKLLITSVMKIKNARVNNTTFCTSFFTFVFFNPASSFAL